MMIDVLLHLQMDNGEAQANGSDNHADSTAPQRPLRVLRRE